MRRVLSVLLMLSFALNIYLWRQWDDATHTGVPGPAVTVPSSLTSVAETDSRPLTEQPRTSRIDDYKRWLEQGDYERLGEALTDALKASPLDPQLLLLEAELMVRTQPLSEAILHYYSLLDLPLPAARHRDIEKRIEQLVNNAAEQLIQSGSWSILAQFIEPLFQRMPLDARYARWLAEAYARQQKPTLTEDVLAALPPEDPAIARIRGLLRTVSDATPEVAAADETRPQPDTIAIALERGRDKYYAHVRFGRQPARLLFDTGATTTAITRSFFDVLARRMAMAFVGNFTVNTAGGPIRASMFEVPVMSFGPLQFTQTPVLVLPSSALPDADGLLGMNVLRAYHFGIDQQDATLTLSSRQRQTNR